MISARLMAARRSAGSSQWLSAKSPPTCRTKTGRAEPWHCVAGFLLGRVCARRVPFLVVARSWSGECREKNYRERQQPWGKRNRWRSRWMFSLRMAFEAAEANWGIFAQFFSGVISSTPSRCCVFTLCSSQLYEGCWASFWRKSSLKSA